MAQNIYLTVSEFAKLHNVNKRTLHYYDSIHLFSPQKTGKNGYRYYTYLQSAEFEIILALRELGMSLDEIRDYQKHKTHDALEKILEEKTREIDERIQQLQDLKNMLTEKHDDLILAHSDQIHQIHTIHCEPEYLMLIDIHQLHSKKELDEKFLSGLSRYRSNGKPVRAFNSHYGSMIPAKHLVKAEYDAYRYLFVKIPNPQITDGLILKPGGDYIQGFCKGGWQYIPKTYKNMLEYARQNHLIFHDYAYEEGINELCIPSAEQLDDYVTRITIPCIHK